MCPFPHPFCGGDLSRQENQNRSAGGSTPKLLHGRGERAQRTEPPDCPGGSRCSSKHNQFKSHADMTPQNRSSWAVLTQMHINLYSATSRVAFICNHLGKLPLLRIVIPLTCRLCYMQVQLFKINDIDWFLLRFHSYIKDNGLRNAEREKMKGKGHFPEAKGSKGVRFRGKKEEFWVSSRSLSLHYAFKYKERNTGVLILQP